MYLIEKLRVMFKKSWNFILQIIWVKKPEASKNLLMKQLSPLKPLTNDKKNFKGRSSE